MSSALIRPRLLSAVRSLRVGRACLAGSSSFAPFQAAAAAAAVAPQATSYNNNKSVRLQQQWYSSSTSLSKEYPPHMLFPMPALSPTMETGTISSWTLAEGAGFGAGDVLCSIETDKASVDFEAQDDGILAKILRADETAQDIPVGTPICVVVEDEADVAAFADFVADDTAAPAPSSAPEAAAAPEAPAAAATASLAAGSSGDSLLLPSARHLSESRGFDATVLAGSGKGGRVTKGDVMAALEAGTMPPLAKAAAAAASPTAVSAPAALTTTPPPAAAVSTVVGDLPLEVIETESPFEDTANSKMRKIIAKRLAESKREVPHFYTSVEVELDKIMALRKKLVTDHDMKVSVNDFIIRCCALALRDVPQVNGTFDPKANAVKMQDSVDISVAVATPTGLITPIVFRSDQLGLSEITDTVRDLATRARDGKLAPDEYQGGTFTISNLGMFGMDEFSAVINPPQAAILAVGGGSRRLVPTPYVDGAEVQAKPGVKTIMTARLSADRRVVDEATAALFCSAFAHYMNEPSLLVL